MMYHRNSSHWIKMHYDVIVVGAGPAGLASAAKLGQNNISVLVVDKKPVIGPKSCAGGITWSGLVQKVPESLIERSFRTQHIRTRLQDISITENHPIIATVDRTNLGGAMVETARKSNVDIVTNTFVQNIDHTALTLFDRAKETRYSVSYDYLIGADGSTSLVRRYLNVPVKKNGIGVNFQIHGSRENMEWHLLSKYFHNGYGWIFPHQKTLSIGAYIPQRSMSGAALKNRLVTWASTCGIDLQRKKCSAGYINHDFRGWQFGNVFLAGDAAGLASALTGEGIYPAILSGEAIAEKIINPQSDSREMQRLIHNHKLFANLVRLSSKSRLLSSLWAEAGSLALRMNVIDFSKLEMSR